MITSDKEQQRLQALWDSELLDSSAEQRFDRITRLAQQVFDVPIALISLVDDYRQWFKSKQGLDVCETPREYAFCKYPVDSGEPLIVNNASEHPDFINNPLVTGEPHIRFYAGVPIHSPEGHVLGTLCVIDTKPRDLDQPQLDFLTDLAHSVESLVAADALKLQLTELQTLRTEAAYQASLNQAKADLAIQVQMNNFPLNEQFKLIVKTCCEALDTETASIWLKQDEDTIECNGQYERLSDTYSSGVTLAMQDQPEYWQYLKANSEVVAADVTQHAVLDSLVKDYLAPQQVLSLLDVLIRDESGFEGCLCIESRTQRRSWSPIEVIFAHDIASLISKLQAVHRQQKVAEQSAALASTLSAVMEAAVDVAIIATASDGTIRIFNRGAQNMLGYSESEVLTKETPLLFHDVAELTSVAENLQLPITNGPSFEFFQYAVDSAELSHRHWTYVRKDGSKIKVLLKLSKTHDQAGNVSGYLGIALDVTDELAAEKESTVQQSRLRALFDLSPVGIALNDFKTGKFLDGNAKLVEPSGYTEEQFRELSYFDLTPSEYYDKEQEMLESMLSKGRYGPFEKEYIRKDGTRYPVLLNGVVIEDLEGQKLIWSIIEDISERKELEEMKSQFISTVSHELRTPLTSVAGALSLLLSGRLGEISPKAQSMLTIANNNSKRLVTLINDLLDFEKLASGNMRFELDSHALVPLVQSAIDDSSTYATQKNIQIQLKTSDLEVDKTYVKVDEERFHQIMNNLLSNALKFSAADSSIDINVVGLPGFVRVMVTDHGLGIPDDFKDKIFKRFQQARASDTRATNGTGLGLAITKELIEAMGGQIDFVSTPGKGSCFYFDLPLTVQHEDELHIVSKPIITADSLRNALVIEDDPDTCEVLAEIYIGHGFHVQTATTVSVARESIHTQAFELISLDLNLPDGKGLDFLHEIRASDLNAESKVIIISGQEMSGSAPENYRSARLDWLLKPVSESMLTKVINRIAGKKEAFHVLHVEDDNDLSQVVSSILGNNFKVTHAATCKLARKFIRESKFDAVLLDVGLPDGSGTRLIPDIKASNPDAAIIILSGQDLSHTTAFEIHNALLKTDLPSIDLQETLYQALKQPKRNEF
ncbi:hypothetical protein CWE09_11600 [Aliidiomarina minuta]|uniref:histidine kinase n=1 Tax=Aliidiomarina minuta TaxID=880057 RepID=A0A432W4Q7_9GAMM|nr:PAS domain S-box protein [Aliidiomarina minuta]RUO24492.1 hypothetical protein CWE09_11600 [Aliidiomarina minuta]